MKVLGFEVKVSTLTGVSTRLKSRATGVRRSVFGMARNWVRVPAMLGSSGYEVRATHDGWMIAQKGSNLPMRVFTKKQEAVREAKKMGRQHKINVDVFTKEGSLQSQLSFH